MKSYPVISLLCLCLLMCTSLSSSAQKLDESDTRAIIQANFLYQFSTNCNWPAEVKKGKFYIGILGGSSLFTSTKEKFGAKPVGNQSIEVVSLNNIPTAQFVHILFIDKSRKADLAKAIRDLKAKNTLIVTNWEGALASGAHINFKTVDGSLRYEMNEAAIAEKKITPGVKIIQWKVE